MAAGQGFKTFATGDVLTAADTNGYLMQGVLVFANATARDAAITSPQEGQTCYLKDTDQILSYSGSAWVVKSGASPLTTKGDLYGYSTTDARIAVGTDGQVLTADSTASTGVKWATASAGSMTLLSTTTLSGTSTTISSISQSYKDLVAIVYGVTLSANGTIRIAPNNDSGACYHNQVASTGISGISASTIRPWDLAGVAASNENSLVLNFYKYTEGSTYPKIFDFTAKWRNSSPAESYIIGGGGAIGISAISSLVFSAGGTITFSSGTVLIYGVN